MGSYFLPQITNCVLLHLPKELLYNDKYFQILLILIKGQVQMFSKEYEEGSKQFFTLRVNCDGDYDYNAQFYMASFESV